jgi:hypothetical protein
MDLAEVLIYVAAVALSSLLTYISGVDIVSLVAAVLTTYYASIGSSMAVVSALTVVAISLIRIAVARPLRSRRALVAKLRYLATVTAVVSASVPVAYIAAGAAVHLQPADPWPLAVLIAASLYVLIYGSVSPTTLYMVSASVWGALSLEHVEELLYRLGVLLGALAMLANVAAHGVLGLILMLIYVASLFATMKTKTLLHRVIASVIMGVAVAVTYVYGYA